MHRPAPGRARRAAALALAVLAVAVPAPARASADLCEAAAARAAAATGVPLPVLRAIALTETGRNRDGAFRPWPWTLNVEGRGAFFATSGAALAEARAARDRGATSFDIGCFQINHRWHGDAFPSLAAMLDPDANAAYAARFLRDLHAETGDWQAAAGAYHSRTPDHAARYRARFARILAGLDPVTDIAPPPAVAAVPAPPPPRPDRRPNRFPLLIAGAGGVASPGSLLPAAAGSGARPLLGDG
jgi:hypothetical protein